MKNLNHKKVVLVGGCFDILHWGHIHFLNEAKKLGDYLIVALEPDSKIKKVKGLMRPVHNEKTRKKMLLSLNSVDEVIVLPEFKSDKDYYKLVEEIKPKVVAITKGDPLLEIKKDQAKMFGAILKVIPKVKNLSSSDIIKALNKET
jgi:cytidyltransferase-related domain